MYWCDLTKCQDSDNETSVTIRIPKANIFTPDVALQLLQNVAENDEL
ncbi:MAG: hypothetical protein FWH37_05575 [Candidatus Bathyarchaeota archaeon]|nr:hypothetical protein [Candidatus Termiticorpusculum sp.]